MTMKETDPATDCVEVGALAMAKAYCLTERPMLMSSSGGRAGTTSDSCSSSLRELVGGNELLLGKVQRKRGR